MISQVFSGLLRYTVVLMIATALCYMGLSVVSTPTAHAAGPDIRKCTKRGFFGLAPWYKYLGSELYAKSVEKNGITIITKCDVKCFNIFDTGSKKNDCGQTKSDIPLVLLAVIDDLLRIAAITAVGFVVYGAFQFIGSQGDSEATVRARTTIINALIGLALAMTAVSIVTFIGNRLGGR
jgi:hypothetical protein